MSDGRSTPGLLYKSGVLKHLDLVDYDLYVLCLFVGLV